jgi:hypothetical protein
MRATLAALRRFDSQNKEDANASSSHTRLFEALTSAFEEDAHAEDNYVLYNSFIETRLAGRVRAREEWEPFKDHFATFIEPGSRDLQRVMFSRNKRGSKVVYVPWLRVSMDTPGALPRPLDAEYEVLLVEVAAAASRPVPGSGVRDDQFRPLGAPDRSSSPAPYALNETRKVEIRGDEDRLGERAPTSPDPALEIRITSDATTCQQARLRPELGGRDPIGPVSSARDSRETGASDHLRPFSHRGPFRRLSAPAARLLPQLLQPALSLGEALDRLLLEPLTRLARPLAIAAVCFVFAALLVSGFQAAFFDGVQQTIERVADKLDIGRWEVR